MITLSFLEFFQGDYDDAGYVLYFVRSSDGQSSYIGISTNSICSDGLGVELDI